jgi:hypothetical protein
MIAGVRREIGRPGSDHRLGGVGRQLAEVDAVVHVAALLEDRPSANALTRRLARRGRRVVLVVIGRTARLIGLAPGGVLLAAATTGFVIGGLRLGGLRFGAARTVMAHALAAPRRAGKEGGDQHYRNSPNRHQYHLLIE